MASHWFVLETYSIPFKSGVICSASSVRPGLLSINHLCDLALYGSPVGLQALIAYCNDYVFHGSNILKTVDIEPH